MRETTKLQCVYCWIVSPVDGKTTHCPHCGQPLHLTDGRRVIDVMAEASDQAAAYAAAGHDPHSAPAAAEAASILRPRATGPTNWLTVLRIIVFLDVLVTMAQLAALVLTNAKLVLSTGSTTQLLAGPAMLAAVVGLAIGALILMWLLRWVVIRVLALAGGVYDLIQGAGSVHTVTPSIGSSPLWVVGLYALLIVYVIVLALSIIYPPPPKSALR